MKTFLARFAQDESGATAIEYGLIAAIVGVGIIAGLGTAKGRPERSVRRRAATELNAEVRPSHVLWGRPAQSLRAAFRCPKSAGSSSGSRCRSRRLSLV